MAESKSLGAGSGFMIDLARISGMRTLSYGLRTMATGGQIGAYQNYRLSAGPLVSFDQVVGNINLHFAYQFFKESEGLSQDENPKEKQGQFVQLGWTHYSSPFTRMDVGIGGYLTLDMSKSAPPAA